MHDIKIRHKENCKGLKMQDWRMRHKKCRAGKCETSQYKKRTDAYGKKQSLFIDKIMFI